MNTSFKKICTISFLSAFICLSFVYSVQAQFAVPGAGTGINLQVTPTNPKPHGTVRFVAESFSTDLNRSTLEWSVNGKVVKSGKGMKEFETIVGKLGTKTEVRLTAKTDIGTLRAGVTLQPTQVDLVWQANSFTPPFYRGRALPTHKSGITVIAIPTLITSSGTRLDPSDLLYVWKENGTTRGDKSGRGKSTYIVREIPLMRGEVTIGVTAATPTGTLQASETIVIRPETPKVLLYEHDPLEGIKYNKAIKGTYTLENEEVTFESMPYFFGTFDRESSDIIYDWKLNGERVENSESRQGSLTLRQVGESGFATLSLQTNHSRNLLESEFQNLSIEFGGKNNDGFAPVPLP